MTASMSSVGAVRDRERSVTCGSDSGEELLVALADPDCQCILSATAKGPKTAGELSSECDIPQSTIYRKLELLTETMLLDERVRVNRDGKHPSEYVRKVDQVVIDIDEDCSVDVQTRRRARA
jgi:DNA-binding transcriptional ArsR family regulator